MDEDKADHFMADTLEVLEDEITELYEALGLEKAS
jgi:hypothetical protein